MSVLRVSVSVECGVWTLDYESAVSGEPPLKSYFDLILSLVFF